MTAEEFKKQFFKTKDQWEKGGLPYRLEMMEEGGITLYSTPTFVVWVQDLDKIKNPDGLAIDECGQIYFMDRKTRRLDRFDPGTCMLEHITSIGDFGSDSEKLQNPTRIIIHKFTIWILDAGNHRVLGFSRVNFQVKYVIDNLEEPVDIGLDEPGNLYVLDRKSHKIFKYDVDGAFIQSFGKSDLKEPVGLAVGKENNLYVIDREYGGFLRFTGQGDYLGLIGDFANVSDDFRPSAIAADRKGNLFVVDDKTGIIHQFDPDGSYIGKIQIPDFTGLVCGIAADLEGNLYVSTDQGIAFLSPQQTFTKEEGIYYSKTLDSGIHECQWHRLALKVDLPPRTVLEVYYYSSGDPALKNTIDEILSDPAKSTQEKADSIDNQIGVWIGPEKNPKDMLFRKKTGRYLWLKLVMLTFDERVKPAVKEMRVYYPRISYLRYLPAIYQENSTSKDFLERFLSLFETVFYDLETDISGVFRYFDSGTTPESFLTWLASWLNLALEEEWPEEKRRELIEKASMIYKLKGTPSGIEALVKIYTGKTPLIIEHSKAGKPMVVGGLFRLGVNSLLLKTPIRGFRLGDDSILGAVALRDTVQSPEDPFLQMAHRFTIILDLSAEEFTRYEEGLMRILNEEKPAHTAYSLRTFKEMRVGIGIYVDINTRIAGYQPPRLGINAAVGSNIVVMSGEPTGRIEQHSMLEKDTELI
jgi:phage tail-like protein